MKLKVGIVGLLVVLIVVLVMTQPRPYLTREGYSEDIDVGNVVVLSLIGLLFLGLVVFSLMDKTSNTANASFSNLAKNLGNLSNKSNK